VHLYFTLLGHKAPFTHSLHLYYRGDIFEEGREVNVEDDKMQNQDLYFSKTSWKPS